jgi:hypothetical protein
MSCSIDDPALGGWEVRHLVCKDGLESEYSFLYVEDCVALPLLFHTYGDF